MESAMGVEKVNGHDFADVRPVAPAPPVVSPQPGDDFLIVDYAAELAAVEVLGKDGEIEWASRLEASRVALVDLIERLPGETRRAVMAGDVPERGRRWMHAQLEGAFSRLVSLLTERSDAPSRETLLEAERLRADLLAARDKLTLGNLKLVVRVAAEYRNRGVPFMDLVQEGNVGLMEAVERYDHQRGFRFSTYAHWWIRRSILSCIANKARMIRVSAYTRARVAEMKAAYAELRAVLGRKPTSEEVADRLGVPVQSVHRLTQVVTEPAPIERRPTEDDSKPEILAGMPDFSATDPLAGIIRSERRKKLVRALATLGPRERKVIRLRFGIGCRSRRTLREIARELCLSRERVRQIETLALRKLHRCPEIRDLAATI